MAREEMQGDCNCLLMFEEVMGAVSKQLAEACI